MAVRVGFIGAGWWATVNHMPLLAARDDVELVSVCGLEPELLATVSAKFGFRHETHDYRELLEQDLDAVVVSTPHHLHAEHAAAALDRGLHVMCEKPMSLKPEDAWKLVRLADERGVHLIVPYGWNRSRMAAEAKRLLETVGIGALEYATCVMASPTKEFFSGDGSVPSDWAPTLTGTNPLTWQDPAHGGGYLHGQLTHAVALLLYLTGARAASAVGHLTRARAPVDLYDGALIDFRDHGWCTLAGSGTLPADRKFQIDIRLFGSEGILLLDVERERLELHRHGGGREVVEFDDGEGDYRCEALPATFVKLVKGGTDNPAPGELGARVVELLDAVARSNLSGERVEVTDV